MKIISVRKIKEPARIIDIRVENNHNFILSSGLVSHNCNSTQPALRGFMEEFSSNCRFIFTCNYRNRILEPIQSRCSVIEFSISKEEKPVLAKELYNRILAILEKHNIEYDPKAVLALIKKFFPDFRRILNELQSYSATGKIDVGMLTNVSDERVSEFISGLKAKNFKQVREWIDLNVNIDQVEVFSRLYDQMADIVMPQSQPNLILILDEFITKAPTAANPKINLAAAAVHLISDIEWK